MKKIKDSIAVIGEGLTEYYYFNSLKDDFRQINIKPSYPKHSTGLDYLEFIIQRNLEQNMRYVSSKMNVVLKSFSCFISLPYPDAFKINRNCLKH